MLEGTSVSIENLLRLRGKIHGLRLPQNQSFYFAGKTRSAILGRGMEYEESRKYATGDDARMIDWRVTARTGVAYTKVFREDKQRTVYLIVDLSSTMRFGTRVAFKSVIAAQTAALFAWTAIQQGDLVYTVCYNDSNLKQAPSTSSSRGLLRHFSMLSELSRESAEESQETLSLSDACGAIKKKVRSGDLIVLISDFASLSEQALHSLELLSRRKFLTTCWILDRIEREALPRGFYPVTDSIRFSVLHLFTKGNRNNLQSLLDTRNQNTKSALRKLRASIIELEPGDDVVQKIFQAFHSKSGWKLRMSRHQRLHQRTR